MLVEAVDAKEVSPTLRSSQAHLFQIWQEWSSAYHGTQTGREAIRLSFCKQLQKKGLFFELVERSHDKHVLYNMVKA